jgi:hypothetical protein
MGFLYDLAQGEAERPITSVGLNWDGECGLFVGLTRKLPLGRNPNIVTVNIAWTIQCGMGVRAGVAEFRSRGYEKEKIEKIEWTEDKWRSW